MVAWLDVGPNFSALASLLSVITALAAVVVSPWFSNRIARRQVGEARINALRDDLCEMFAISTELASVRFGTLGEDGFKFRLDRRSRARCLNHRIRLRLSDPEGELSKVLIELITQLFSEVITENPTCRAPKQCRGRCSRRNRNGRRAGR